MKPETITKQIFKIIPALLLVALSAFLLQGDVWTFWTWCGCYAADRATVPEISGQRLDVFKSDGDCRKWFPYLVSGCGKNY